MQLERSARPSAARRCQTFLRRAAGVTTAAVLLAAGPAAAAPHEPNDGIAQAVGPLGGGTVYGAALETRNDADWFFFYTTGRRQLDIAVTNTAPSESDCWFVYVTLADTDGQEITSKAVDERNTTGHMRQTVSAGRYFLHFRNESYCDPSGTAPGTYQFRVDPFDALSATPPLGPTVPSETGCDSALVARDRALRRLASARKRYRRATTRNARRRWGRQVRQRKATLRKAKRNVTSACG